MKAKEIRVGDRAILSPVSSYEVREIHRTFPRTGTGDVHIRVKYADGREEWHTFAPESPVRITRPAKDKPPTALPPEIRASLEASRDGLISSRDEARRWAHYLDEAVSYYLDWLAQGTMPDRPFPTWTRP